MQAHTKYVEKTLEKTPEKTLVLASNPAFHRKWRCLYLGNFLESSDFIFVSCLQI